MIARSRPLRPGTDGESAGVIASRLEAGGRLAFVASAGAIAWAVGLGVLRLLNSQAGQRRAEGVIPTVALVVLLAAPGVLGFVGMAAARPSLFLAAGAACLPLGVVSIAATPIWIAGALLVVAFARSPAAARGNPRAAFCALLFFAGVVLGVGVLLFRTGEYSYRTATGGQEGEYLLPSRAAAAIVIVATDLAVTVVAARSSAVLHSEGPS